MSINTDALNNTKYGEAWAPTDVSFNSGDNSWQLTAATIVGLQSVPGLVIMYAGLMKKKWAINSAFMAFYGFAATLLVWVLYAYRAGFGYEMLPFVGIPGPSLEIAYELAPAVIPSANITANFPMSTMIYFQFTFAAITVVLIAGSFLGRMNFLAWIVFVPLWVTLSYTVGCYSLFGGGFLAQYGVLDYCGGYVIHLAAGTAGYVGAYWIGPRTKEDREENKPNNVLMVLTGAGILWLGWNGFNGGGPYAANADAGVAVLNTNICTAVSLLTWLICDIAYFGKPSVIGMTQGMICGLVVITPGAGYVDGWAAIVMGICAGAIPFSTMNILFRKFRFLQGVDDTLGSVHTHMIAGILGGFTTGIFATAEGAAAFASTSPGGAVSGNPRQIGIQLVGAVFIAGWNVVWTSLIMLFIKYVLRIPLRMSEEHLKVGDFAVHGEEPYIFGEDHRLSLIGPSTRYRAGDVEEGVDPTAGDESSTAGEPSKLEIHELGKEHKQA